MDVLRLKFDSPDHRRPRRDDERVTRHVLNANNKFTLELRVPRSVSNGQESDVVILVNGFSELETALPMYHGTDWSLSNLLGAHGLATVLLPLPFHHQRRPRSGLYKDPEYTVARSIAADKFRFYLGFKQIFGDVLELAQKLKDGHWPKVRERLSVGRIHVVGFSMGGLGALSAFCYASTKNKDLLKTCTLLFSGTSLRHLSHRVLGVEAALARAVKNYYLRREYRKEDLPPNFWEEEQNSSRLPIFEHLILQRRNPQLATVLREAVTGVQVILGQEDKVNPSRWALWFIPRAARRRNIYTVHGVGHLLWNDPEWKSGAKKAVDWLVSFLKPPRKTTAKKAVFE